MIDGSRIPRNQGESLQQGLDRIMPGHISAIVKLVSPQVAASSYVSEIIEPTEVMMHTVDNDEESDDEHSNEYAVRCEEDLDELTTDELQLMVRTLNNQLKNAGKSAPAATHSTPRKKKDTPMPMPAVPPSVSTPTQSTATNSSTPSSSQLVPYKPTPSTIVPQVRYSDQKGKAPEATGPDFHYQCPIEDKSDSKKVLDRILGIEIPISARKLLSLSPNVRKQIKELTTTKKVRAAAFISTNIVSNFNYTLDACDCHGGLVVAKESHALRSIVPIVDGTTAVKCILDSGCQIIGMSRAIWMSLGSMLNPKNTVSMQPTNGTVD